MQILFIPVFFYNQLLSYNHKKTGLISSKTDGKCKHMVKLRLYLFTQYHFLSFIVAMLRLVGVSLNQALCQFSVVLIKGSFPDAIMLILDFKAA